MTLFRTIRRWLDWRAAAVDEWDHRRGAEAMLTRRNTNGGDRSPSPLRHRDPRVPPCVGVGDDLEAEGSWPMGTVLDAEGFPLIKCGPACDVHTVRPGSLQCNATDDACPNRFDGEGL